MTDPVSERAGSTPSTAPDAYLLQRLRALVHPPTKDGWLRVNPDGEEAAAHIEALQAKLVAAKGVLRSLRDIVDAENRNSAVHDTAWRRVCTIAVKCADEVLDHAVLATGEASK